MHDLIRIRHLFNPTMIIIITFLMMVAYLTSQCFSAETDTINSTFALKDPDTIISSGHTYKLGFFTPQNTTNRYLGILYVVSGDTVFWVANRDKPLADSSGTVAMSRDGNIVLTNGQNETIWSTKVTSDRPMSNTTARISDMGNLVLSESLTGDVLWESFSHPTDYVLPLMPLVDDTRTGNKVALTSWKNVSDPAIGDFIAGVEAQTIPQLVVWNRNWTLHYRTGPWNGQIYIGVKEMYSPYRNELIFTNNSGVVTAIATLNDYPIISVNSTGNLVKILWDEKNKRWDTVWTVPQHECDVYGKCGPFAICNIQNSPSICSCLRGFEPVNVMEWERWNWTSGCVRIKPLQCKLNSSSNAGNNYDDDFLKMPYMKVPDFPQQFPSGDIDECRVRCLSNCSCVAYAHDSANIGCMLWWEKDGLIDTQQFPSVGVDLYIRLAASEIEDYTKLIITIPTVVGFVVICFLSFVGWCWIAKRKGSKDRNNIESGMVCASDSTAIVLNNRSREHFNIKELPLFSFKTIAHATNQFQDENMLGKGGFGHVYKGKLANGKEIAVKRLSEASTQGTEEFMNEVVLISKLQHKNLVRLLGCCVENEEKMLIYEYLPNKSLDTWLFDSADSSRTILDWKKRMNIIDGIGRGLLYLHRDSRLRIIHRDLKPSNVLLDNKWNPKISDFGMARIFGNSEDHANTARVVGTYGYMAPEYAVEGRFSDKSDVFSFGVLMLEIISGKKTTHYYNHDLSLSLIGSAWRSWSEDEAVSFVNENIIKVANDVKEEMLRCICIALLCAQEYAEDRPSIQTALSMLSREIVELPLPKQPLFAEKWNHYHAAHSINQLSITKLDGR